MVLLESIFQLGDLVSLTINQDLVVDGVLTSTNLL
jgi:hypothetical protein